MQESGQMPASSSGQTTPDANSVEHLLNIDRFKIPTNGMDHIWCYTTVDGIASSRGPYGPHMWRTRRTQKDPIGSHGGPHAGHVIGPCEPSMRNAHKHPIRTHMDPTRRHPHSPHAYRRDFIGHVQEPYGPSLDIANKHCRPTSQHQYYMFPKP